VKPWSLVSFRTAAGGERAGVLFDGRLVDLPISPRSLLDLIDDWPEADGILRNFHPVDADEVLDAELLLPLRYPRKVLCSGANYRSHMREMKVNRPDDALPYFFLKPPTTSLVGPGEPIVVPADPGAKVDWEAELAVVIGRRARHVKESEALDYVAGYSAINDISLRGPHRVQHPIGEPFQWDWLASKGADQSTPLGPGIRPAFLVDDPQRLDLRLWVNGHLKQEANTSDMVVGVAALTRRFRLAVNLAVAGFGCYFLALLVKSLVHRGRPSQYLPHVNLHGPAASGLGFISGHAAVAVALASVASPYLSRRARRVAWTLAAVVCLSRVYVGAHWPLDVIGGAAVGFAVGAAVHLILGAPGGSPSAGRIRRALLDSGFQPEEVVAQGRPDTPARPGSWPRPRMGSGCSSSSSRVSGGTGILRTGLGGG